MGVHAQNWCANGFPTPAGYITALIDFGGTPIVAINVHMYPEYDTPFVTAQDIRDYQFSELAGIGQALFKANLGTVVIAGVSQKWFREKFQLDHRTVMVKILRARFARLCPSHVATPRKEKEDR